MAGSTKYIEEVKQRTVLWSTNIYLVAVLFWWNWKFRYTCYYKMNPRYVIMLTSRQGISLQDQIRHVLILSTACSKTVTTNSDSSHTEQRIDRN